MEDSKDTDDDRSEGSVSEKDSEESREESDIWSVVDDVDVDGADDSVPESKDGGSLLPDPGEALAEEAVDVEPVDEEPEKAAESGGPPSKPPSIPDRPDDVRGARETPDEKLTLKSGDTVGGRFTVQRYLGSSGGGISYLCREAESGRPVVIKVLAIGRPDDKHLERIRREIRTVSQIRHKNLTDILGMGTTEDGQVFVAMNFVEGDPLSQVVKQQRDDGREISLAEVFHVLAHLAEGLKAVHEQTAHGVLTPFNVYLTADGTPQIQNLGFGRVAARFLQTQGEGPFVESIYVAPEVIREPANLSPRADIYSLGMLAAELLSGGGLPRQKEQVREVALRIGEPYGDTIEQLVVNALAVDPSDRIASAGEFRMNLENSVRAVGVDPAAGVPERGMPVKPAVDEAIADDDDDDLFDIPGPGGEVETIEDEGDERYLIRKDGLDYGPFTKQAVLEQLYDDEIDEHTSVLDRATQNRAELGDLEAFEEEVAEYVPKREERRRRQAERRAELERKVKKGGVFVLVVGILAGVVVLAGMSYYYFTRPAPEKLPMEKAFVSLDDRKFLPPPKDFQTVAADDELLEQIFNPEAEQNDIAKRVEKSRGGGSGASDGSTGGAAGGAGGGAGGDDGATTVDMSESGGSKERLTDKQINDIILSDFSALRRCIQKELDNDPSFTGVTVKFYVRPNGTTGGVTLQEKKYLDRPVGRCLVQEFQQMEFPAHSAIDNKGVTFPLTIQR